MVAAPKVYVNGILENPANVVMPISISMGRSRPESQPDAPDATLTWRDVATAPVHGDEIRIMATLPPGGPVPTYDSPDVFYDDPRVTYGGQWLGEQARFVGIVTDVDTQEVAGRTGRVRVVAVSRQAELGRTMLVLTRPSETDVARVLAIMTAAGAPVTIHGNAGPMLVADEIDRDALGAVHEVCVSSGGVFWSDTNGNYHYGTGDHRELAHPMGAIGAHAIISGLRWQSTLADLINKVTVKYGADATEGEHTLTDDASITAHGLRAQDVTTQLINQDAGDQLAALILARRAWPYARISDVMMDSDHVSGDLQALAAAFYLAVGDPVLLPIPPDPGPAGLLAEWIVEGWQEEWDRADHVTLQIAVSDRARFAQTTIRTWNDALPFSWQAELDRGSWLDTLIMQPGESAA